MLILSEHLTLLSKVAKVVLVVAVELVGSRHRLVPGTMDPRVV